MFIIIIAYCCTSLSPLAQSFGRMLKTMVQDVPTKNMFNAVYKNLAPLKAEPGKLGGACMVPFPGLSGLFSLVEFPMYTQL